MLCTDFVKINPLSHFTVPCAKARNHLNPDDVLKSDVVESLSHVESTLDVLTHFKGIFNDRRNSLTQYQRNGMEVKPWDFSNAMVFAELDRFMGRLKLIEVSVGVFVKGHTVWNTKWFLAVLVLYLNTVLYSLVYF